MSRLLTVRMCAASAGGQALGSRLFIVSVFMLRIRQGSGIAAGSLAALLFLITGCGGGGKKVDWGEAAPVSGEVTMDGKAFETAFVNFIPLEGTKGPGASGMTDSTGKYSLIYRGPDGKSAPGAIPGKYKVTISRYVRPDGSIWSPDANNTEGPMTTGAMEQVPQKYSNAGLTNIQVDVGPSGGTHNFKVTSK